MPGRFTNEHSHTARKTTTRQCWLCGCLIQAGEEYTVNAWREGGRFGSLTKHTLCARVLNLLTDDPYDLDMCCLADFDPYNVQAVLDTDSFTEAERGLMDTRLDLTNRLAEDD